MRGGELQHQVASVSYCVYGCFPIVLLLIRRLPSILGLCVCVFIISLVCMCMYFGVKVVLFFCFFSIIVPVFEIFFWEEQPRGRFFFYWAGGSKAVV